jgi:hypothetical protein
MEPTIQLIQLTLRVEREAEAQRRPYMVYRDDLVDEKPVRLLAHQRDNRVKRIFNLFRRRQPYECA